MLSSYFRHVAKAGVVLTGLTAASPVGASLPIDSSAYDFKIFLRPEAIQQTASPYLYSCMIDAALKNAQANGKLKPKAKPYEETILTDKREGQIRMVSALRLVENFDAGAIIKYKLNKPGADSLTIDYIWNAAAKESPLASQNVHTIVAIDVTDLTGYTSLKTEAGPQAIPENARIIELNALHTAGAILQCVRHPPPITA